MKTHLTAGGMKYDNILGDKTPWLWSDESKKYYQRYKDSEGETPDSPTVDALT